MPLRGPLVVGWGFRRPATGFLNATPSGRVYPANVRNARFTSTWKRATLFQKRSLWLTRDVGYRETVALRPWRYGQLVRIDFSGNAAFM